MNATEQQIATDVWNFVGVHGAFAILGTIILVRAMASLRYWERRELMGLSVMTSAVMGVLAVWLYVPEADGKAIAGGVFMTVIGTMITYEAARWLLRLGIELRFNKPGEKTLRALYFFLTPKGASIKMKQDGNVQKIKLPPHPELTQLTSFTRVDVSNHPK